MPISLLQLTSQPVATLRKRLKLTLPILGLFLSKCQKCFPLKQPQESWIFSVGSHILFDKKIIFGTDTCDNISALPLQLIA